MNDIVVRSKLENEGDNFFIKINFSNEAPKKKLSDKLNHHIRNTKSSKTKEVTYDEIEIKNEENKIFYENFLLNIQEETKDRTNHIHHIKKKISYHPIGIHRLKSPSKIKKTKKIKHSKEKNHHNSYSPNLNLNTIIKKVFSEDSYIKEKPKKEFINKYINKIIKPQYIEKQKLKYKNVQTPHQIAPQTININHCPKNIEKENPYICFWHQIMCCIAKKPS